MSVATTRAALRQLLTEAPVFLLLIACAGLLWQRPAILTLLYLLLVAFLLWRWRSPAMFAYFTVGLVLGPSAEYFAVGMGAWSYPTTATRLPLWLPLAWGIAAIYLKRAGDALEVLIRSRAGGA